MCFKMIHVYNVYMTHSKSNGHGTTLLRGKNPLKIRDRGFAAPQSESCQDWVFSPVTSD